MKKNLLNKKIKDLTLEDIRQLEKPLGTSTRPFPMQGPQRVEQDGKSTLDVGFSAIASDDQPLRVFSERSYEEVAALAYADMPVPSMLDLFMEALERRADPILRQKDLLEGRTPQNENFNRTQMLLGDPGHGKSFMGALMGRLRSTSSVEVYDCGGKNMNDLLFEMVLDFGAGDALPTAIDKKLAAGALEPLSLGLLKQLPNVSKDADGNLIGIDWAALKTGEKDKVEFAYEILKKVASVEGLDKGGGNALGMNSQYGALVRAFLENREIVLDEYNKSREGSDNALQTVIQFLIGEIRECTVENPLKNKDNTSGPSSFTFRRDDMGAGFFVTLTGNKTEDGITTRSLNRSVYDRLKPDTLPDPSEMDWQHRICQMMVGLPVSTLHMTFKDHADADPEAFGEWLMWLRETKAKVEGTEIPELQRTLLTNWQNVVNASEKLAKFYHRWAAMTDAEKITSNGNAALIEEIDEEYSKKEAMSFRRIKQHLEEAIPLRPRMLPQDTPHAFEKGNWKKAPQLSERVEENPSLHFGTRLVEYIENMVYKKSEAVGKSKLYAQLISAMEEIGLRDVNFKEAAHSQQKSVEADLNISAFADRDLSKQAVMARKIFCDYIRQMDASVQATDEEIVTVKRFTEILTEVAKKETALTGEVFVANRDLATLAAGELLSTVSVRDTAVYALEDREELDFTLDDLVPHDDFLASLALPTVGAKNLLAIWDTNIRKVTERGESGPDGAPVEQLPLSDVQDEALRIAERRSELNIATTTVYVLDEVTKRPVPVHVITNTNRNKTLVISQKVPSKLQAAFNEAGIVHVDVREANAKLRIDAAIKDITRGLPADAALRDLTIAFNFRNAIDDEMVDAADPNKGKPTPTKLIDMIFDSRLDAHYHKYLLRAPAKPALKAA